MPDVIPFDPSETQLQSPDGDHEPRAVLSAFVASAPARTCLTLLALVEHPPLLRAIDMMLDELSEGLK